MLNSFTNLVNNYLAHLLLFSELKGDRSKMRQLQLNTSMLASLFGTLVDEIHRPAGFWLWARWVALVVPALFVTALFVQPYVEPRWLFLDTITSIELSGKCCHVYFGMVSNLGIMLWTGGAAICLFAALVLMARQDAVSRDRAMFALVAGLFTGWLALDDAFLVHEKVFPALGLPQGAVLLTYAVLAILFAVYARRVVFQVDLVLFVFAIGFLAASVLIDHFHAGLTNHAIILEDGAKFIGICCWATFHAAAMARFLGDPGPMDSRARAPAWRGG